MNKAIYLDYAATTPVDPTVVDHMMQHLTLDGIFANSGSIQHVLGEQADATIEQARNSIAQQSCY